MAPFIVAELCPGVRRPAPRPASEACVVVGWAEPHAGAGFPELLDKWVCSPLVIHQPRCCACCPLLGVTCLDRGESVQVRKTGQSSR